MARTLQSAVGFVLIVSFIATILHWRLTRSNLLLIFFPTFIIFFGTQVALLLSYMIFVAPRFSSIRHLPQAPQKPWHQRLLKEPNAFHFERWVNEMPNDELIRYFGFLNAERVLVTSPRAVCEVMHVKAYDFEKQYSHKTHLKLLSSDSLVTVEGKLHKFQRKTMNPLFWTRHVNEIYYPVFWEKANEMTAAMGSLKKQTSGSDNDSKGNTSLDETSSVDDLISRAIFDIMGEAAFGQDLKCLEDPSFFHEPAHEVREAFNPTGKTRTRMLLGLVLPASIVDYLPIEFNRRVRPGLDAFKREGLKLVDSKKSSSMRKSRLGNGGIDLEMAKSRHNSPERKQTSDLMSRLANTKLFDDQTLLNQFMMFHTGGTHTSIMALKSAIWFLAQSENLHMQRRLRREVRANLPMPGSEDFDIDAFRQTPYLVAVRNEIFRLHSAFSTTGRQAVESTAICGTVLPPGMPVSISPWAIHRSKSLWGEDADKFDPSRWLPESSRRRPTENGSYISFGIGPRACIGENFAKAEINCLLAALFGKFQLEFVNGQELPRVTHQVTVAFKEDIRVKITRVDGW